MSVDFQRVMELVYELREIEPDRRRVRLVEIGREDTTLRSEVESLLAHGDAPPGFLDTPAFPSNAAEAIVEAFDEIDRAHLPRTIGRYRVLGLLGAGGMGTIYRAEQDHPRREVAVKLIRRQLMSSKLQRRFRQETEILGRLQHPGIAQVHDAGTIDLGDGEQPYLVMELIRGVSITTHADEAALDTRARLGLLARVCDVVEHAHQKGVIHRDLKPDNILVQEDGTPKILDFGIARVTDPDMRVTTHHTDVGQIVGTIPYMSPEQLIGDAADVDTRTDVYALGAVLFELLSGRLPYDVSHCSVAEAARIIRDEEPTRLGSIESALRGDIETITTKAMAKELDRRYQSAAAFAADIRRYLANQPVVARPTSTLYQLRKFVRRNRGLSIGVTTAVVALLVGVIASTSLYLESERERSATVWQSYVGNVTAAGASISLGEYREARLRLAQAPEEHRNWEWRHWHLQQDTSRRRIEHGHGLDALAVSRDRGRVVTVTDMASMTRGRKGRLWDLESGELLAEIDGVQRDVAITAAGDRVVSFAGSRRGEWQLVVWSPERHDDPVAIEMPERGSALTLARDDSIVVAGTRKGHVLTCELDGREQHHIRLLYDHDAEVLDIATSPDGGRIASCSLDGTVRVWDLQRQRFDFETESRATPRAIAFSPDGTTLAVGDHDGRIVLRTAATGVERGVIDAHAEAVTALAFHCDSVRLVSGSQDSRIHVWDTRSERRCNTMGGHADRVGTLAVDPSGHWILSGGNDTSMRVWDIDTGGATVAIGAHTGPVHAVRFCAAGSRIVSTGEDATLVWNATSGELDVTIDTSSETMTIVGDAIVTAGWMSEVVSAWSLATGEALDRYPIKASRLWPHPDGVSVVTAFDAGPEAIVNLRTGTVRELACDAGGWSVATSADGRSLLTGRPHDDVLTVHEIDSAVTDVLEGHTGGVCDIAVHPDGERVVTASADHSLRIWDLWMRRCHRVLRGHTSEVRSVDISPDGTRIVSGAYDGTVRVWDVATGDAVAMLRGHEHGIHSVAFSPDGSRIVSGDGGGVIRVWETDIESARRMWRRAAQRVARQP